MERKRPTPVRKAWEAPPDVPHYLRPTGNHRAERRNVGSGRAEANNSTSTERRPLYRDCPKLRTARIFASGASPTKRNLTKKSNSAIALPPEKRKRGNGHPLLLPSLASVASPSGYSPQSRSRRTNTRRLPRINDSPSADATSNGSEEVILSAQATAIQCIDHASRRQTAAKAALRSTSKISSSLKELLEDSNRALDLARKSRVEAENAEVRAEGAATKVKDASEMAMSDIERSKLELEEANAQAEEAWEFLRRVKGMAKGEFQGDDQYLNHKKGKADMARVGTIVEFSQQEEISIENSPILGDANSLALHNKIETAFMPHGELKKPKDDCRKWRRFHQLWDDVSVDLQCKRKSEPVTVNSKKDSPFEPITKFTGHTAPVTQILVIDKHHLLSSSWDKTIRLWDANNGECLRVFRGHADWVHSICMSSDGHFLSGSDDRSIKMWHINKEECIHTYQGHSSFVKALALLDGDRFLSGSRDRTIKLWKIGRDECIATFKEHTDIVSAIVALNPDRFLSGSHDKTIKLWDVPMGRCIRTIVGHSGAIKTLAAISGSEHLVISGSDDRTMRLWDTSSGICLREFGSKSSLVFSVTFICEGFFVSCGGGKIQLWHIPSGSCVKSYDTPRISLAMACLDDERFVTGSDQMIHMWKF